jgi:uncharacterized protein
MRRDNQNWTRREFIKTAGLAGAASIVASLDADAGTEPPPGTVPVRPFGKTGVNVSILSLGGMFDIPNNQLLLKQALRWGVSYWDTADCYGGGASEKGIGKYLRRNPADRERIFLVTKSDDRDPEGMTRLLDRSLQRLHTGYVDLYLVHGLRSIGEVNEDTRKWAENAKAEGKIRLFGFSTHSNMAACMAAAARLGWIDGIMMAFNYRLMHAPEIKAAVSACRSAGIGLTAMKTQGGGQVKISTPTEMELAGRFLEKGFTDAQARLKAVWEEPAIASICSQMPNMTLLMANAAAAMDRTRLSAREVRLFHRLAMETRSGYCSGCGSICESVVADRVPIADVMRYLMYSRSYGERERARALYREIDAKIRDRIPALDYSGAERRCPQGMAIGRMLREAFRELV